MPSVKRRMTTRSKHRDASPPGVRWPTDTQPISSSFCDVRAAHALRFSDSEPSRASSNDFTARRPRCRTSAMSWSFCFLLLRREWDALSARTEAQSPGQETMANAWSFLLDAGRWILQTPVAMFVLVGGLLLDSVTRLLMTFGSSYFRLIELPTVSFGLIGAVMAGFGIFTAPLARRMVKSNTLAGNYAILFVLIFGALCGAGLFLPWWGVVFMVPLGIAMSALQFQMSYYLNYADALATFQPEGTFLLGGWSAGGTLAHEIAVNLQKRGRTVGLLAIIDLRFDGSAAKIRLSNLNYLLRVVRGLPSWIKHQREMDKKFIRAIAKDILRKFDHLRRLTKNTAEISEDPVIDISLFPKKYQKFILMLSKALREHIPENQYRGRAVVYEAKVLPVFRPSPVAVAWSPFISEFDVVKVAGSHLTLMQPPYLQTIARDWKKRIEAVPSPGSV